MASKYIKLDWDWADAPEAEFLRDRYGKKALLDWVQLMVLMSEFGGSVDLKDPAQMAHAMRRLRKNEEGVMEIVDRCAECGLIDADAWRAFGRAGSARALRDARAREGRKQWGEQMQELSTAAKNTQHEAV